jgi:alcohol dehydrogenase class IV
MNKITFFRLPNVILIGCGALEQISDKVRSLDIKHALIVTDEGLMRTSLVDTVKERMLDSGIRVSVFHEIRNEPSFAVVNTAGDWARTQGCDGVIGLGGGSSMDSAKGIALVAVKKGNLQDYVGENKITISGLPTIMIPTTAGTGSEVTGIAIFTDEDKELKVGIASPYIIPDVAIVDPELTISVPPNVTAFTGIDALTHAIEAFVSVNATPETDAIALGAIKLILNNIREAVADGSQIEAREGMAHGSLLAGVAFANAGVAAVHALAYPLGARYHLPHGLCNSMLLPYVMEASWIGNVTKFAFLANIIEKNLQGLTKREVILKGIQSIKDLIKDIGIPLKLREVGVKKDTIRPMAEAAINVTRLLCNNPRKLTVDDIEKIYKNAY